MTAPRFLVLGPLEVWHDGRRLAIPAGQARVLLATLLLHANQPVPVHTLVERLWDGAVANPGRSRATLQMVVRRLRQALGDANVVRTTANGYVAEVDPESLDLHRFRELVARGEYAAALGLWRGEPFSDVRSDLLHAEDVEPLLEERLVALERRIDVDLAAGRTADLVPELRALTRRHPLRERLWGQLMLALYRSDRQAEALAAYQTVRDVLVDELGVDPGAALQEVHRQVLAGDAGGTSAPPDRHVPRQLPPDITSFVGRDADLAALDALLAPGAPGAVVVSAIAGTAGVGKTALAVRWAHRISDRFPDGRLFVDFQGYQPGRSLTGGQALSQVLRGLGVPAEKVPVDQAEQTALYRSLLADRRVLVVLDNVASPDQVRPLLPANPDCLVLVTSRSDLAGLAALNDARVHRLDTLAPADALDLLGRIIGPDRVAAEPAAAAELVARCAWLPLAVRIAAADLAGKPHLALADYVEQLGEDRLRRLAVEGDPDAAVLTAFAGSYLALAPDARVVFRRLGLVPGPDFTRHEAAVLTGTSPERAGGLLDRLVGVHLVEGRPRGRYALHDLLRLYAREQALAEDGTEACDAAERDLLQWYHDMVKRAADVVFPDLDRLTSDDGPPADDPRSDEEALDWFKSEQANLLAAVSRAAERGLHGLVCRVVNNLNWYFYVTRDDTSWRMCLDHGLRAARAGGLRKAEGVLIGNLGSMHYAMGDPGEAVEHYTAAARIFAEISELSWYSGALNNLGSCCQVLGRLDEALRHLTRSLEVKHAIGSPGGVANALLNIGCVHWQMGRLVDAERDMSRALAAYREIGSVGGEVDALGNLGEICLELGRFADARRHSWASIELSGRTGAPHRRIPGLCGCAEAEVLDGNPARAAELLEEARRGLEVVDNDKEEVDYYVGRGRLALHAGDLEDAASVGDIGLKLAVKVEYELGEVSMRLVLSEALRQLGRLSEAREHAERALVIVRRGMSEVRRGQVLREVAESARAHDEPDRALDFARRSLAVHRETGQRYHELRSLRTLQAVLAERGDTAEAERCGARAAALGQDLGLGAAGT